MNQKKHYIIKKLHTFNILCSVSLYVIVISPQYMLWNFYWHCSYQMHEFANRLLSCEEYVQLVVLHIKNKYLCNNDNNLIAS